MKTAIKLFLILICNVVLTCCSDKNTYEISGKLDNCNRCQVYLMEMQSNGVKALDTIQTDKKGKFKAKEILDQESIFILQGKNDYIMICPKVNERLKITGDYTNLAATYGIEGSAESSKLKILNDEQTKTRLTLKLMSDQLAQMNITNVDSVKREVARLYKSIQKQQREFLINYINNNEGSLTVLVALYRNMENHPLIDPIKDTDIYEKVLNGLKKKYPDNPNTENLERLVENIKQAKQNQTSDGQEK